MFQTYRMLPIIYYCTSVFRALHNENSIMMIALCEPTEATDDYRRFGLLIFFLIWRAYYHAVSACCLVDFDYSIVDDVLKILNRELRTPP